MIAGRRPLSGTVRQVVLDGWRCDVTRHAIEANPLANPNKRRTEQCMLLQIDLRTGGELGLHGFSLHSQSGEPPAQLQPSFCHVLDATLINNQGGQDVFVPARGEAASIHMAAPALAAAKVHNAEPRSARKPLGTYIHFHTDFRPLSCMANNMAKTAVRRKENPDMETGVY
jgi:hypothetical protein